MALKQYKYASETDFVHSIDESDPSFADLQASSDVSFMDDTINSTALEPVPTSDFQTPEPEITYPVGDLDATPPMTMTPTQEEAQGEVDILQQLNEQLLGESAATTAAEEEAGIPEIETTLTDLTSQLSAIQAEAKQIPLQMQQEATGRGITTGGLRPLQTARLRTNAIQALGVSALIDGAKGLLASAYKKVEKAMSAKYDPIYEEIRVRTANLELILNSPQYSIEEKNQAQKQLDAQNAILDKKNKEEADETTINNYAVKAAEAGADAQTLQAIQNAKTPEEALQLLSELYASEEEKAEIEAQIEFDNEMTFNGFTKLTPSQLPGLEEEDIIRIKNPITRITDIYKRPPEGMSELEVYEAKKQIDARYKTPPGGGLDRNKVLSITDAKSLGVPYGTTVGQAMDMGITPGEGDLTPEEEQFQKDLNEVREDLATGGSWGNAWDTIKNQYTDVPNETLDELLDKGKYYEQSEQTPLEKQQEKFNNELIVSLEARKGLGENKIRKEMKKTYGTVPPVAEQWLKDNF